MARVSILPKQLQPMLATLTDGPFDDKGWIFEDKYDGFRMVAKIAPGKVALYSRNGKIISHSYIEVAKALEGVKGDAVIDGELVALDDEGVSHFQLLQNALRREAKLRYFAFDLMFQDGDDLRGLPLTERKKRLKSILPKHKLIGFSRDRKTFGTRFLKKRSAKASKASWRSALTANISRAHGRTTGSRSRPRNVRRLLSQASRLREKRGRSSAR
ncbi:ATP-dependent DNA ligase [Nitrobacter vulgaris]|nr:ATP-dependent DNA ligase [Nitrobacter vulgaris]